MLPLLGALMPSRWAPTLLATLVALALPQRVQGRAEQFDAAASRRRALARLDVRLGGMGGAINSVYTLDVAHELRAARGVVEQELIMSFPSSVLLSVGNARLRSPGAAAFYDELLDRSVDTALAAQLAAQLAVVALHLLQQLSYPPAPGNRRQAALQEMWRAYVESLPRDASVALPLLWDKRRLRSLGGSALRARIALQRVRHAAQWALLRRILAYPRFADGARGEALFARFDFDDWLRALAVVQSRWFSFDAVGVERGGDAAVVPLLDMANHEDEERSTMRWGVDGARLVVRAAAPLAAGAPLTDSYGSAHDFLRALPHLLIWLDDADEALKQNKGDEQNKSSTADDADEASEQDDDDDDAFSFWSVGFLSHLGAAHLSTLIYGFAAEHYACVVRVVLRARDASADLARRVTLVARFTGGDDAGDPVLLGASAAFWHLKAERGSDAAIAMLATACAAQARRYTGQGELALVARLELALLHLVAASASRNASAAVWARNALRRCGTQTPSGTIVLAELARGGSVVLDAVGAVTVVPSTT